MIDVDSIQQQMQAPAVDKPYPEDSGTHIVLPVLLAPAAMHPWSTAGMDHAVALPLQDGIIVKANLAIDL